MEEDGNALLEQLERILECDRLIDEVGFVHPTQLAELHDDHTDNFLLSSSRTLQFEHGTQRAKADLVQYDGKVFWHGNHKLAISTFALSHLYSAALRAYRDSDRKYKMSIRFHSGADASINSCISFRDLAMENLKNEILRHSKALLILSCDFGSAWNSRRLVILQSCNHLEFLNELQLSELILSYCPKSDYAWTQRRWVIRMISGNCPNLEEIIGRESELVKTIAEKTKMNYRAWNHRGCLVPYMSRSQVLGELSQSKSWAKLHIADSSCFHYRRRLMLRLRVVNFMLDELSLLWKEELDWNQSLIEQYAGREALWMHRRFLLQWGLGQFAVEDQALSPTWCNLPLGIDLSALIDRELQMLQTCFDVSEDQFEETNAQADYAASYLLWMWKHVLLLEDDKLIQKLKGLGDIQSILNQFCPKKAFLSNLLNVQNV